MLSFVLDVWYAFSEKYDDSKKQAYKYNDEELDGMHQLNFYDYSARYYESAVGRFTSVDPHAESYYSWSPYAYVGNNPLKYTDPTGMDWWTTSDPAEIERVLAALNSGKTVESQSFGDQWERVEKISADDYAVFDDESSDFSIDGISYKDYQGFGAKDGLGMGNGFMSLGAATIWGGYTSDINLAKSGRFRLSNKVYKMGYYGGTAHTTSFIKASKTNFAFGVKVGGYAKLGGNILSYLSVASYGYDAYNSFKNEDPVGIAKSIFNAPFTVLSFCGPQGAAISGYWSATDVVRDKWAEEVLLPYMKTTNGIIYPAFFPFK
ncbi:RHS repeat-associated core domain-containing protein [Dysgonomonas sp. Marseille-P4677]|uniref:RHS repeat-associated core domain-containing protein n=1 Tax=Dysgonomonas sp. Marseille-P4677 TaxID=2364790 RepID=UPI001911E16B|nr:RHS repeat-associated core domain-containing protein [Dysgonomonas sp. Marseille-P4677]